LEGKTLERANTQEGLDRQKVLNTPMPERTLEGSKAVKSAKGTSPVA